VHIFFGCDNIPLHRLKMTSQILQDSSFGTASSRFNMVPSRCWRHPDWKIYSTLEFSGQATKCASYCLEVFSIFEGLRAPSLSNGNAPPKNNRFYNGLSECPV